MLLDIPHLVLMPPVSGQNGESQSNCCARDEEQKGCAPRPLDERLCLSERGDNGSARYSLQHANDERFVSEEDFAIGLH